MLGRCALRVEERTPGRDDAVGDGPAGKIERDEDDDDDDDGGSDGRNRDVDDRGDAPAKNGNERRKRGYSSVVGEDDSPAAGDCGGEMANSRRRRRSDAATFDFVGMASALFDAPVLPDGAEAFDPDGGTAEEEREGGGIGSRERRRRVAYDHPFTRVVLCVYYVNLVRESPPPPPPHTREKLTRRFRLEGRVYGTARKIQSRDAVTRDATIEPST
mmetsp:Transcript_49050/g.104305  ORF Transcript_49050/g.104305 Transcript_49050/m.104305 type:complete len:216 (-) Transcript_49050:989-1636(-)